MHKQGLLITLQEACVLSQRNATEGAHRGLDYITGSSLFGAVASQLYTKEGSDSFKLFHSGQVHFRNAYPINEQQERTYPMPLCWYGKKKESQIDNNKLDANKVWRIDALEDQMLPADVDAGDKNPQPQQVRSGFLSLSGKLADVKRNFQLKTAINTETKRAQEEALFGYESIQKGQQFYCEIEAEDISDLEEISATLAKGIFIGRSRSAEYGKAKITLIAPVTIETSETETDGNFTLWCLSDAMIYDKNGQITLTPSATDIGLSKAYKLDITRSHIRARSYSAWNQHKQAYELEKQVIQKGSVLVYKTDNIDKEEMTKALAMLKKGIGVDRTLGLGHVWVNPPLLEGKQPTFNEESSINIKTSDASAKTIEETKPLIKWLDNTAGKSYSDELQAVREAIKTYQKVLSSVDQVENKAKAEELGPSRSQWGKLLQRIKLAKPDDDIEALFETESNTTQGWPDKYYCKNSDALKTIKSFVLHCLKDCIKDNQENTLNQQRYLQFFAREAMSLSNKPKTSSEKGGEK